MMAKWYQMASSASPPMVFEKMCAMPTASEGAPPVRFSNVSSPTSCASRSMVAALTGKPQEVMVAAASPAPSPTTPAGLLMAK